MSPCKVIRNKIDSVSGQDKNLCINSFLDEEGKRFHYYFTGQKEQSTLY